MVRLLDHIIMQPSSQCIQQLLNDGCSPAEKTATRSLLGLSPRWALPSPKPPTWGLLWLLLFRKLLDSCLEPQSVGRDVLKDSYSLFVHWPSDRTCSQMVSEQEAGQGDGGLALAPPAGLSHPWDWSWALTAQVPD